MAFPAPGMSCDQVVISTPVDIFTYTFRNGQTMTVEYTTTVIVGTQFTTTVTSTGTVTQTSNVFAGQSATRVVVYPLDLFDILACFTPAGFTQVSGPATLTVI
jgi:hypothetical protein